MQKIAVLLSIVMIWAIHAGERNSPQGKVEEYFSA
jgi:hypothetical protein